MGGEESEGESEGMMIREEIRWKTLTGEIERSDF
jgi:hypothetical protein